MDTDDYPLWGEIPPTLTPAQWRRMLAQPVRLGTFNLVITPDTSAIDAAIRKALAEIPIPKGDPGPIRQYPLCGADFEAQLDDLKRRIFPEIPLQFPRDPIGPVPPWLWRAYFNDDPPADATPETLRYALAGRRMRNEDTIVVICVALIAGLVALLVMLAFGVPW